MKSEETLVTAGCGAMYSSASATCPITVSGAETSAGALTFSVAIDCAAQLTVGVGATVSITEDVFVQAE